MNLKSPSQIEFVFKNLCSSVQGSGKKFKKSIAAPRTLTLDSKAIDLILQYTHQTATSTNYFGDYKLSFIAYCTLTVIEDKQEKLNMKTVVLSFYSVLRVKTENSGLLSLIA